MKVRLFEEVIDYPEVSRWWEAHHWPVVPRQALPQFGMVAEEYGIPLCAGWLYITTTSLAWIEWLVTNPDVPMKLRKVGLELLLERLLEEAKGFGAEAVFSSLKSKGLIRLYQRKGFVVTDTKMTNLIFNCGV